ncbi:MAG: hypothetical protein JO340_09235 [Acidobacteriaceae bacterium]|nr:hypothetical protein [Acidobacteriaceae bacterium]
MLFKTALKSALLTILLHPCACPQQESADQLHERHRELPHYNRPGASLRQALLQSGKQVLEVHSVADRGELPGGPDEADLLAESICASSAIVVGSPTRSLGLLSASETTVFTDYHIRVDTVLRNVTTEHLAANETITLSRPFGEVHLAEGTIHTSDPDYPALQIGAEYIFFLETIAGEHKSFESQNDVNTYLVTKQNIRPLARNVDAEKRAQWLSGSTLAQLEGKIAEFAHSCK